MPNSKISLILMNSEEKAEWLKNIAYKTYSPRHDDVIEFVKASQVSEYAKHWDMSNYRRIQVSETSTVSDVIAQARRYYSSYDEDFQETDVSMFNRFQRLIIRPFYAKRGSVYGYQISYHLCCPSLGSQQLNRSIKISELKLVDDDLIVIEKRIKGPMSAILTGVTSFQEFQDMVWGNEYPYPHDPMLLATLLYTDEDVYLAKYVRGHFDELHQMSGPRVITYVLERPQKKKLSMLVDILEESFPTWSSYLRPKPKDNTFVAPLFWKDKLDVLTYHAWALLGWTLTKPLNRTAAYEIACKLGIYPDQLPCLAVFDRTGQAEKIVFPVSGDYTSFFRSTFSNIQRALNMGAGSNISNKTKLNRERLKLFNKLRESLSLTKIDTSEQHTTYDFYGQTVFVNHPTGSVQLSNFQNTPNSSSETLEKGER
jgi:hypothetical protein